MTTTPTPDRVTAIYDAIDAFQRKHQTGGGLGHAQIRALLAEHLDQALPAAEPPLSPYYEHPKCGFHWHGKDGMDVPLRDGEPVCPRCELARAKTTADLLRRTEAYLSALHGSVARHDNLAANLGCAGCELRDQVNAELRRMADEAQQEPDPSWPRRAWDLGLLHKGGDPHHCPACLKQPEPPANFVCPGDNTEVLANPQPAEDS